MPKLLEQRVWVTIPNCMSFGLVIISSNEIFAAIDILFSLTILISLVVILQFGLSILIFEESDEINGTVLPNSSFCTKLKLRTFSPNLIISEVATSQDTVKDFLAPILKI